jgi:aspartyl/asparaginyl beta-hydroxylase (cupin superfamily)
MNPPAPVWYAFSGKNFPGGMPRFYENESWPWLEEGKNKYVLLRNEIENLLTTRSGALQPYFNTSLVNEGGKWEIVNFYFWGKRNEENLAACPELKRFLEKIPGLLTAGLSRLSPFSEIKTHIGDTNAIARCHLGLSVPSGLPLCGLRVENEDREWKEGDWLIFCDAYPHSAWNKTEKARYILLLDILLPEYEKEKTEIVKNIQSIMKLQEAELRNPWIKKLPGFLRGILRRRYKSKL